MTTGNLRDLAALPSMPSAPSIVRMALEEPDFPVIRRGGRGRAWIFDLDTASAFVRERWARHLVRLEARSHAPRRAAHPGRGNLAALVALEGMPSAPTLQRFIEERPDFPIIERAAPCHGYVFDLDAAAQFIRDHWRDRRRSVRDSVAAEQLALFDADPGSPDNDGSGNRERQD